MHGGIIWGCSVIPKISVLVPTRDRIAVLQTMLVSLYAKVSDADNVEVIARVDDDDQNTLDYLRRWPWVRLICKSRVGYAKNAQMVNECATESTGDLLLVANDDLIFETQDWDLKLATAAAAYPDGIFDLCADTVLNNENCCFPCISRRVYELLGHFFDARLLYPDIWLRDVMIPFGRVVRVPEVVIRHNWMGQTEDQQRAVSAVQNTNYEALYARCVEEARNKIVGVLQPC